MFGCRFILPIILFKCLFIFGYGEKKEKDYYSLVVSFKDGVFNLKVPFMYDFKHLTSSFEIEEGEKLYHFCGNKKAEKHFNGEFRNGLYTKHVLLPQDVKTDDMERCKDRVESAFLRVQNVNELKNMDPHGEVELYHSGFLLHTKAIRDRELAAAILLEKSRKGKNKDKSKDSSDESKKEKKNKEEEEDTSVKPKYMRWNPDFEFIPIIATYINRTMGLTQAVEYTLISMKFSVTFVGNLETFFRPVPPLGNFSFIEYTGAKKDLRFFDRKIGLGNWRKFLNKSVQFRFGNAIFMKSLACKEHFPLLVWKRPIEIHPNLVPSWLESNHDWLMAQSFARIVARYLGDIKTTSGITGVMTLPGESAESSDTSTREVPLEEQEYKFRIPNYIWSVFEFYFGGVWFGILMVLHNNVFYDNTPNLCHDISVRYGWKVANKDFRRGKIYCCQLTERVIKLLEADFLGLQPRRIFNLYEFTNNYENIFKSFDKLQQPLEGP